MFVSVANMWDSIIEIFFFPGGMDFSFSGANRIFSFPVGKDFSFSGQTKIFFLFLNEQVKFSFFAAKWNFSFFRVSVFFFKMQK